MAKNDNLKDFLTDVANAIRAKKGISNPINPQNFSSEIASIETGGGGGGESTGGGGSDVRFLDYDGTLLYSFSKDDFLALSALPYLPTREGLTCQGWNYNIEDAKEYVTSYGVLDIGAMYITDDGKTRLYIKIAAAGRMSVPLYFSQTTSNGVTIDWGDGSATETLSGTGNVNTIHTYANIGDYVITLDVTTGTLDFGAGSSSYSVMGSTGNNGLVYCNMLQKVEIGSSVTSIGDSAFQYCRSLVSVVIPSNVTSIGNSAFRDCSSLASIVIPSGVTSISRYAFNSCSLTSVVIPSSVTSISRNAFNSCSSLVSVVIPSSVTSISMYAFQYCNSLVSVVIPSSVTSIGDYTFNACFALASVVIPSSVTSISSGTFNACSSLASVVILSGVTSISSDAFNACFSLASVVIPSSVTSISSDAFNECFGMAYYDFRASESVPTLSNTTAFTSIPNDCKIVVPDSLYETWIAATNWSSYASQIVKASEFKG